MAKAVACRSRVAALSRTSLRRFRSIRLCLKESHASRRPPATPRPPEPVSLIPTGGPAAFDGISRPACSMAIASRRSWPKSGPTNRLLDDLIAKTDSSADDPMGRSRSSDGLGSRALDGSVRNRENRERAITKHVEAPCLETFDDKFGLSDLTPRRLRGHGARWHLRLPFRPVWRLSAGECNSPYRHSCCVRGGRWYQPLSST